MLEIDVYDGATGKTRSSSHEQSVARYFDENGVLVTKNLYNDLAKFFNAIADEKKSNWIILNI